MADIALFFMLITSFLVGDLINKDPVDSASSMCSWGDIYINNSNRKTWVEDI